MSNSRKVSTERGQATLTQLEQALERLIAGNPVRTPKDGKININRVGKEAGLSVGGIYYYDEFVKYASSIIDKTKAEKVAASFHPNKVSEKRLRDQRDNEKRLKEEYRDQRDSIKKFCDKVVHKNAQLEYSLYEALEKIERLEDELTSIKVSGINKKL